jgi:hypothetical protein
MRVQSAIHEEYCTYHWNAAYIFETKHYSNDNWNDGYSNTLESGNDCETIVTGSEQNDIDKVG